MSAVISSPTRFQVGISPSILEQFPDAKVAVMLARIIVEKKPGDPAKTYLEQMKANVVDTAYKSGLRSTNYQDHRVCKSWDKAFATFGADPSKKSTIHYLFGRVGKECDKREQAETAGKKAPKPDLGRISNFVDFYNNVSILTQTPMGALDLSKIDGPIELRYGRAGETFRPLGKTEEVIDVLPSHVVYADNSSILTWLWNHRDAKHACVPDSTENHAHILLFADQADQDGGDVEAAIAMAMQELPKIGGQCLGVKILDKEHPECTHS